MVAEELNKRRSLIGTMIEQGQDYSDICFENDDLDNMVNEASKDPNYKVETIIIEKETVPKELLENFTGIAKKKDN